MDLCLTGTTALVTGSTQGIGYSIAAALLAEGAAVVVNGRSEDGVATAVARLREGAPGADVSGVAADVATDAGVRELVDAVGVRGGLDVLVNNAGIFDVAAFDRSTDEEWQRYLDLNLMSGVRLGRALLGGMLEQGWGRMVFVNTESAVDVPGDMIPYGVTKAAALALANGLAKLTRGTGVTVNSVLAGPTYSDGVATVVEQIASAQGVEAEDLKASLVRGTSLLGRFIEPAEVASLVAYLASPLTSAVNGAALRVDGGVLTTT